jgi:hypothetical protein
MATIKKTSNKCWLRCGEKRSPCTLFLEMQIKISSASLEISKEVLQKTKSKTKI